MAEQTPLRAGDPGVRCRHEDEGFCNQHNLHCTAPRCFVRDGDQSHVVTARRPADIAAELRDSDAKSDYTGLAHWPTVMALADELDALDRRWPTADEIAEQRRRAEFLRTLGYPHDAIRLTAFLDRLDPPQPEPQGEDNEDPDGRSGVDYCLVHHGIRNEDEYPVCDFADDDTSRECVLVPLTYDPATARAALDARGQR